MVGNANVNSIGGQVGWTTLSDGRFKKNIRNDEVKGLDFIIGLQPVTYNYDVRAKENRMEQNFGEKEDTEWEGKYDIENIRFSDSSHRTLRNCQNLWGMNLAVWMLQKMIKTFMD